MRHNFRELSSWKKSFQLVKEIYHLCEQIPNEEKFGIKSQMQRSAVSIPSNIAEGSGRTTDKEFTHFLNLAVSSSYELETQLLLSADLFNIEVEASIAELHEIQRFIGGLKKKLNVN